MFIKQVGLVAVNGLADWYKSKMAEEAFEKIA
jgi:hypothetical protein